MHLRQLVRQHKITLTVLRQYEHAGLLEPRRSSARGWRDYSEDDTRRIGFIASATAMGFTFPEIREFVAQEVIPQDRIEAAVKRFTARHTEISSRLQRLRAYARPR